MSKHFIHLPMQNTIQRFYTAFQSLDAEAMVKFYHNDVVFEDPAFGVLKGEHAKNMWRMLINSQKGKKFVVQFSEVQEDESNGTAKWEALYKFSHTNRWVHNHIYAQFEIENGLITKHIDRFNLFTWSCQAMGLQGYLLGWTPFFQRKLQEQTNGLLKKFEDNEGI